MRRSFLLGLFLVLGTLVAGVTPAVAHFDGDCSIVATDPPNSSPNGVGGAATGECNPYQHNKFKISACVQYSTNGGASWSFVSGSCVHNTGFNTGGPIYSGHTGYWCVGGSGSTKRYRIRGHLEAWNESGTLVHDKVHAGNGMNFTCP